jgi:hypothetical protein
LKSSVPHTAGAGAGGQYARSGSGGFDRYEPSYGAGTFGDDDYLSDVDLQDDIDSQRFGAYGSAQRAGRTTQKMGSRTGMPATKPQGSSAGGSSMGSGSGGSSMSGSSTGSSSYGGSSQASSTGTGATQASPAGSSLGASTSTTTKNASTPPAAGAGAGTSSTSPSTSTSGSTTPKNGLGGGNMGSV